MEKDVKDMLYDNLDDTIRKEIGVYNKKITAISRRRKNGELTVDECVDYIYYIVNGLSVDCLKYLLYVCLRRPILMEEWTEEDMEKWEWGEQGEEE